MSFAFFSVIFFIAFFLFLSSTTPTAVAEPLSWGLPYLQFQPQSVSWALVLHWDSRRIHWLFCHAISFTFNLSVLPDLPGSVHQFPALPPWWLSSGGLSLVWVSVLRHLQGALLGLPPNVVPTWHSHFTSSATWALAFVRATVSALAFLLVVTPFLYSCQSRTIKRLSTYTGAPHHQLHKGQSP